MRIELTTAGGIAHFPGLTKPVAIEVDRLDKAQAEQLKRLVESARFFDLPAEIGSPQKGAADFQHYLLTIDDGARRHTVRALVPVEDPALQELIQAVRKHVAAARSAERASSSRPKNET